MIIKKFFDKDSRAVLAKVRREFGPEAVLLSSKTVGTHFEMIAASPYKEKEIEQEFLLQGSNTIELAVNQNTGALDSPAEPKLEALRSELQSLKSMLEDSMAQTKAEIQAHKDNQADTSIKSYESKESGVQHYLKALNLSDAMKDSLKRRLDKTSSIEDASNKTIRLLSKALPEADLGSFPESGMACFLGQKESGKTTALMKIAERHRKTHGVKGMALVYFSRNKTRSNPLWAYGRKTGTKFIAVSSPRQLGTALRSLVSSKLVLIDFDSEILQTKELETSLAIMGSNTHRFLILEANAEIESLTKTISKFSRHASSILISKYDKPSHLSGLAELLIRHRLPLAYRSDNAKVTTPILPANSHALIRRALDLSDFFMTKQFSADKKKTA